MQWNSIEGTTAYGFWVISNQTVILFFAPTGTEQGYIREILNEILEMLKITMNRPIKFIELTSFDFAGIMFSIPLWVHKLKYTVFSLKPSHNTRLKSLKQSTSKFLILANK